MNPASQCFAFVAAVLYVLFLCMESPWFKEPKQARRAMKFGGESRGAGELQDFTPRWKNPFVTVLYAAASLWGESVSRAFVVPRHGGLTLT